MLTYLIILEVKINRQWLRYDRLRMYHPDAANKLVECLTKGFNKPFRARVASSPGHKDDWSGVELCN